MADPDIDLLAELDWPQLLRVSAGSAGASFVPPRLAA